MVDKNDFTVDTEALEDFSASLMSLKVMFHDIYEEIEELQKNSKKIVDDNMYEINKVLHYRYSAYQSAYDQLCSFPKELACEDNSFYRQLCSNLELKMKKYNIANNINKEINTSQAKFQTNINLNAENIESKIADLSDMIDISVNILEEFLEIIIASDNAFEEINSSIKGNTISSSGIISRSVFRPNSSANIQSAIKSSVSSIIAKSKNSSVGINNVNKYYYKNHLQALDFKGYTKTQQVWNQTGEFAIYNSPVETGKILDSNQGKMPNFLGTCGCVSCVNVLKLAGIDVSESKLVLFASTHTDENGNFLCSANRGLAEQNGATSCLDRKNILSAYGMESILAPPTIENIFNSVSAGKGVIASVHALMLYEGKFSEDDYHAITITSVKIKNNKPYSVIVCDSNGMPSQEYSVELFAKALTGQPLNITKQVIR